MRQQFTNQQKGIDVNIFRPGINFYALYVGNLFWLKYIVKTMIS